MKVGDKVKVNVPDEKWCHGCTGVVESTAGSDHHWWIRLEDVAKKYLANNPYEFSEDELTASDAKEVSP